MAVKTLGSLTVVKPGLQTLLQDQGRTGLAFYAIPPSGPLDPLSAEIARALVGNSPDATLIECNFIPPTLRFDSPATICLAGADMQWTVDGKRVDRQAVLKLHAGSELAGSPASEACRAYIAIAGEIQTQRTFGSTACYPLASLGGNEGQPLAAGDTVGWKNPSKPVASFELTHANSQRSTNTIEMRVGPEFDWLTAESVACLFAHPFAITPISNRMGARLTGPKLSTNGKSLRHSVPLLPGMVQLPPSGQCIVVLQDGQTTGGYLRIGYIPANELAKLNQIPVGREFRLAIINSSTATE